MDVLLEARGLTSSQAPYEVASRASNLAEQLRIAAALAHTRSQEEALSSADTWKLQRLARRLAASLAPRSLNPPEDRTRSRPPALGHPELERALKANRQLQLRSGALDEAERQLLDELHAAWLPSYAAALGGFEAPAIEPGGGWERRRQLAAACAPFRHHLRRQLEAAVAEATRWAGRPVILPAVAGAFEGHLIDRFELCLAWAIEVDRNVARARSGAAGAGGVEETAEAYCRRRFGDAVSCHRFYVRFPVLGRWLAVVTRGLIDNGRSLIGALCRDVDAIGQEIFGEPVVRFTSLELGKSDYHVGGRSVGIVGVDLASGPASFVYKPRPLDAEVAMQSLLQRLTERGVVGFAPHRVVARDGYGYEERIPPGRNDVPSRQEASRIYREIGGFLGIFHILGGSDLHYENLLVSQGRAFVCDCETALRVAPAGQEPAAGTVVDSVYRTGLLEWPLDPASDVVMRQSGCEGGQSYEIPFALPRLQDGPELAVRHEAGIRVEQDAPNRVRLGGAVLEPKEFRGAIVGGFSQVHEWFEGHPSIAAEWVRELFGGSDVRFVARSTQIYVQLLLGARHPKCLMEPLEADLVFHRLTESPHPWDRTGQAAAREFDSLWQLDVPVFSAQADGTALRHDQLNPIPAVIDRSPLEVAVHRIGALSPDDRLRQVEYIGASLSSADEHSEAFGATAIEYAELIGTALAHRMDGEPMDAPGWFTPAAGAGADGVATSLYYGSAGLALFLAYLDSLRPSAAVRAAAEQAADHALAGPPGGAGAFQGLAGRVYLLTHLHRLWGGTRWLDLAVASARGLDPLVDADRAFDVLTGCAGVIPVMLGLAGISGEGLPIAHRCAGHLLRHAEAGLGRAGAAQVSWPPERPGETVANFTGFAHGAAGIGWALIALGVATGREDYVETGRRAFAYEAIHFDDDEQDWADLRTSIRELAGGRAHFGNAWCNGAAGIGLSRIASWAVLGKSDDGLLKESYQALAATLRNFAMLGNDTLCHGQSGNAELFLRFAALKGEVAFQLEANVQAQGQWRRLAVTPGWPDAEGANRTLPGLMIGLAGIGLHFLRLAQPVRVPSPLLLDPPPGG